MLRYFVLGVSLLLTTEQGDSARILALFPFPGKSHFISFSPLLEALAARGHQMTVVSAFPRNSPLENYDDMIIDNFFDGGEKVNLFESHKMNILSFMVLIRTLTYEICENFLQNPVIQDLIHSTDIQFDLIIYEPFFTECGYGFIHKFKAPFIQIFSHTTCKWMGDGVGNPFTYSYIPEPMLSYSDHMTFTERMTNAITLTLFEFERNWISLPRMESLIEKYFKDPTMPSILEIENNASFLLLNSDVAHYFPRPLTPNTALVGGMHIKEPKKLPKDLQKLMDNSVDGVVYFSLGSNVRSVDMPEDMRRQFLNAFSKLKQTVLWKWESDTLPGQPKNVHLSKWFPQNDILGHPNLKVFITHGGLLSTQEATYFGVPLITIPFWADQRQNALKAERQELGICLDVTNITQEQLGWALHETLTNPRYSENSKKVSRVFRDQPQTPLERAVFWTEYVIRHKGAPHMRSAALDLNFFQYCLLDVIAFILLIGTLALALAVIVTRKLFRLLFRKSTDTGVDTRRKKTN